MLPAYVVSHVDASDTASFREYKERVTEVVRKYGGEYLVRGGRYERLEGREPATRHVIMRFPSYEQALAWYHSKEYKELKDLRLGSAPADIVLIEGMG
jgi:uncharacterized protein (DUF1330 family)